MVIDYKLNSAGQKRLRNGKDVDDHLEFFKVMKVIFLEITQYPSHASQKKTNKMASWRSKILQFL